ncbi:Uncharacterised protein [Klebsiella pneumoniae]|nr:Uncharacterised protein [Klebsiella pneumoniae]
MQSIVVVPVILLKTVKKLLKQVVKVVSTAAGTLKMIRSVRPKRVKKADRIATAVAASPIIPDYPFPCTLK